MRLTFLGHQGWMVESGDYRLLIDPIITPYFRNSPFSRVWLYPPRALDLSRIPKVDAVYFSHEHEDHFHIESIHALPRSTTLYLSANISEAAERILREMGFDRVTRLYAMEEVALGAELSLKLFPPPAAAPERWVLQPYVRGRSFADSFFNPVDCPCSPDFLEWLRRSSADTVGLVCLANNQQIGRGAGNPCDLRPRRRSLGANLHPAGVLTAHLSLGELPGLRYLAIVGGGFIEGTCPFGTFRCGKHDRMADVLLDYSHQETRIFGAEPGDVVDPADPFREVKARQEGSLVVASEEGERALREAEEVAAGYSPAREYEPVTGRKHLDAADQEELERRLSDLSRRLSCHPFHAELMQQGYLRKGTDGAVPYGDGRLLLALLRGGFDEPPLCYEYQPIRHAFVEVPGARAEELISAYPFGFECWAQDLLALTRGELCVFELIKYRHRFWAADRTYYGEGHFGAVLEQLFAPDLCNDAAYALYRSAYERALGR